MSPAPRRDIPPRRHAIPSHGPGCSTCSGSASGRPARTRSDRWSPPRASSPRSHPTCTDPAPGDVVRLARTHRPRPWHGHCRRAGPARRAPGHHRPGPRSGSGAGGAPVPPAAASLRRGRLRPRDDIAFLRQRLPRHPNALRFTASGPDAAFSRVYYSVGGGFIVTDDDEQSASPDARRCRIPSPPRPTAFHGGYCRSQHRGPAARE